MIDNIEIINLLDAKSVATEIVLLALLREKRGDAEFWNSLEKLSQVVLNLDAMKDPELRARAESVQYFLDSWRSIAGDDPRQPSPPGSGPWTPRQE